jgi:hypothetical protein
MPDSIFREDLHNLIERSKVTVGESRDLMATSKEIIKTSRAIKRRSSKLIIEKDESANDQIALEAIS